MVVSWSKLPLPSPVCPVPEVPRHLAYSTLPSPWSELPSSISPDQLDLGRGNQRGDSPPSAASAPGCNCPSGSPMCSTLCSGFGPAGLFHSGLNVLSGVFSHMQSNIARPIPFNFRPNGVDEYVRRSNGCCVYGARLLRLSAAWSWSSAVPPAYQAILFVWARYLAGPKSHSRTSGESNRHR